jgi:ParB-like chromosome segregation protein Spo0J
MPRLPIADLLADGLLESERHLDARRVEEYARALDAAPPVVVFATADGLLLADGYHRLAAARQRGETTIEAEVRPGSRQDALRFAAAVGAAQRGISIEEALAAIEAHSRGR